MRTITGFQAQSKHPTEPYESTLLTDSHVCFRFPWTLCTQLISLCDGEAVSRKVQI